MQTSLPLPNRRTTTFGTSIRYTSPGNCSGSYSTLSRPRELEALRAGADDLPASEQERRGLRFLQTVDESGELLRLVFGPAESEGDRLEVELLPEGGGGDDVLNLDFGQSDTTISLRSLETCSGICTDES